jgi:peptidoglycan L-alanyl-D-glutamate endopeptidase CwlK
VQLKKEKLKSRLMPSRKIEDCVDELQAAWRDASASFAHYYPNDSQPIITCTYRTNEEQLELYAQGRTKPGPKVTRIKQGGKHNSNPSKAFDIAFKTKNGALDWSPALFSKFAAIIKLQHPSVEWGGDWKSFKDLPHFQV